MKSVKPKSLSFYKNPKNLYIYIYIYIYILHTPIHICYMLDIYTYVYNIYLWVTDEEVALFTQGLLQRYY